MVKSWLEEDKISKTVTVIGKKAKIVVRPAEGDKPANFASSHDLLRSFAERWAGKVMPQDLREMMRYEDIKTTLRYYVGRNAARAADAICQAFESGKATVGLTQANGRGSLRHSKTKKPR